MHGRKLTLNEVDKEKINYRFSFNCVQVYEKVFIYHNFPDTEVVFLNIQDLNELSLNVLPIRKHFK